MTESLLPQLIDRLGLQADQALVLVDRPDRLVARLVLPEGARVAKIDRRPGAFEREVEAMATLGQAGLPVSTVVLAEHGPPAVLVATWADGEPISAARDPASLRQVGGILRRIHALPATAPWSAHPTIEQWIDAWLEIVLPWWRSIGAASATETEAARQWLDTIRPWLGDQHGSQMLFDGRPEHFLLDGTGRVHLIDVADLQPGDPVMDLAVLELDAPGILTGVLAGYHPSAAEQARIEALVPFYVMLRAIAGAEWQASIGGDLSIVERNLAVAHQAVGHWMNQRGVS